MFQSPERFSVADVDIPVQFHPVAEDAEENEPREAPVEVAAGDAVPGKLTDLPELPAAPATKIVDKNSWDAVTGHCLACLAASMLTIGLKIKPCN